MTAGWLAADWNAPRGVHAGTATRRFAGVSEGPFATANFGGRCGDDPAAVARNRALLRESLQLPSEPCWLHQVHGIAVARLDTPSGGHVPPAGSRNPHGGDAPARVWARATLETDTTARDGSSARRNAPPVGDAAPADTGGTHQAGAPTRVLERATRATGTSARAESLDDPASAPPHGEPQADAAVTRRDGVVLAILTADCLPVVFASADGEVIAAAHAGWRGLAAGVLEATLDAMAVDPARTRAWFGPAAGAAAYEVGEDVRSAFVDPDPGAASAFIPSRPGHWHCDLYALARRRLAARGLEDIAGGTHCTITDRANFHSHRRDGCGGRIATLVWRDSAATRPSA